jgi:hypothetical protein
MAIDRREMTCRGLGTALVIAVAAACVRHDATAPPLGAANSLVIISGDNQSALAGRALAQPIVFKLTDVAGNGAPHAVVTFQVVTGEGSLAATSASATTDSNGTVSAPTWTLGKLAIAQELSATAGNLSAKAYANIATQYHAELRFFGPSIDAAYMPAFARALNRLNAEVVGQLAPVTLVNQDVAADCGAIGVAPLSEEIGTLVIYASVAPIDGAGGIVASSGPCYVRQSSKLTVVGTMLFDVADLPAALANGQLNDAIFHEMHHVLGFGTTWSTVTPSLVVNAGTPQTGFVGTAAILGCRQATTVAANCLPAIPLENHGGPATADSHWRESIFGNELMTASLAPPNAEKPLSAMTIESLRDLGYETNRSVAAAYSVASTIVTSGNTLRAAQAADAPAIQERVLPPRFTVTPTGIVSAIP